MALVRALSGAGMSQQALAGFYQRMQALNDMMSSQNLLVLPKDGLKNRWQSEPPAARRLDSVYDGFKHGSARQGAVR